jgi:hypothetical protein
MSALERRAITAALHEANHNIGVELDVTRDALNDASKALAMALRYITKIERENEKLRRAVVELAGDENGN